MSLHREIIESAGKEADKWVNEEREKAERRAEHTVGRELESLRSQRKLIFRTAMTRIICERIEALEEAWGIPLPENESGDALRHQICVEKLAKLAKAGKVTCKQAGERIEDGFRKKHLATYPDDRLADAHERLRGKNRAALKILDDARVIFEGLKNHASYFLPSITGVRQLLGEAIQTLEQGVIVEPKDREKEVPGTRTQAEAFENLKGRNHAAIQMLGDILEKHQGIGMVTGIKSFRGDLVDVLRVLQGVE